MLNTRTILTIAFSLAISATLTFGHAHTHIGRNQDQIWGTADDNTLWLFAMPGALGWPNWGEPLELVLQESGPLAGKYVCEHLQCWHSGHPDHGDWQLGGTDPGVTPDWRIGVERVSFDEGFAMAEYDTFVPVLTSDEAIHEFPKVFMDAMYNENGELGAWGFHYHLWFIAEANGPGEVFNATFHAVDLGMTGFDASEAYTMSFVTVPEPAGMALLGFGGLALIRRRRK